MVGAQNLTLANNSKDVSNFDSEANRAWLQAVAAARGEGALEVLRGEKSTVCHRE